MVNDITSGRTNVGQCCLLPCTVRGLFILGIMRHVFSVK